MPKTREQFHTAMLELYDRITSETDYVPGELRRMTRDLGGQTAAVRLVDRPHQTTGFDELVLRGRADLTVEALVGDDDWAHLFDAHVVSIARRRTRGLLKRV